MTMHRLLSIILFSLASSFVSAADQQERWDRDIGKPAPRLVAAGWIGTPVSLSEVKGNTIVLAFWNTDVPWC